MSPSPWDSAANTIELNWKQKLGGELTTSAFFVKAGPTCADGTTWTPTLTYTDASGDHTETLREITVRSKAGSDLSIQHVSDPVVGAGEFGVQGR